MMLEQECTVFFTVSENNAHVLNLTMLFLPQEVNSATALKDPGRLLQIEIEMGKGEKGQSNFY